MKKPSTVACTFRIDQGLPAVEKGDDNHPGRAALLQLSPRPTDDPARGMLIPLSRRALSFFLYRT